jgi:TRAP-type C4-dicarboxylate transport system substrate-binding protein
MRGGTKMKKCFSLGCVFVTFSILFMGGVPTQGLAKSIELNLVSYAPKNTWNYQTFESQWIKKVNERAKGELVVKFRGGPETIGVFDQAEAVSKGVTDMALNAAGFFGRFIPGADVFRIPDMTAAEWRKNGTFAYMQELYGKKGVYFVGWQPLPRDTKYFYLVSRMPLRNREDIKGKKFACSPPGVPFFKKLGAAPVVTPVPEFYSTVERGVADGNWIGIDTYVETSHYEVAPYVIDHPFANSTLVVIMNLKKWNALPDHLKKLVTEVQLECEANYPALYAKYEADVKKEAAAKKAQFIKWSPEDAKWLHDTYAEATWEDYEKLYGSEIMQKYKQLWGVK